MVPSGENSADSIEAVSRSLSTAAVRSPTRTQTGIKSRLFWATTKLAKIKTNIGIKSINSVFLAFKIDSVFFQCIAQQPVFQVTTADIFL